MNILKKLLTFFKSLWFHVWSGFPKCTKQEILQRFTICQECEFFDNKKSQCLVCGCNVNEKKVFLNKLAWADQNCPENKWSKINRIDK
jgi:uncharacterized paraquat-inducible protein A